MMKWLSIKQFFQWLAENPNHSVKDVERAMNRTLVLIKLIGNNDHERN